MNQNNLRIEIAAANFARLTKFTLNRVWTDAVRAKAVKENTSVITLEDYLGTFESSLAATVTIMHNAHEHAAKKAQDENRELTMKDIDDAYARLYPAR